MAGINLPEAYSKILDRGFTLKSLTAPAFKGKYRVVGGTTKTFKIYSTDGQDLRDYSSRKNPTDAAGVGSFGYEYQKVQNKEQVVEATQDKYFAGQIDLADAHFSRDGSLDASEFMRVQMEEYIFPTIDKWNISQLISATPDDNVVVKETTTSDAFSTFKQLTTAQTNAKVPHTGRIAFASATFFSRISQDEKFTPASELTAKSRRNGNYGRVDNVMIIEVPDDYLVTGVDCVLTHELAAAAPKHLADYNQGKFKESASGYYVNGRVVFDAFVFDKKKTALQVLRSTAASSS